MEAFCRPLVRSPVMLFMGLGMACLLSPRLTVVFLVTTPILAAVLAAGLLVYLIAVLLRPEDFS